MRRAAGILIILLGSVAPLPCQRISLLTHDAVVWSTTQTIPGMVDTNFAKSGILYVNGTGIPFQTQRLKPFFTVTTRIPRGTTTLVAVADSAGTRAVSDTVRFTLGYMPRPEVHAYATVAGRTVALHASVLENPDSSTLSFTWSADPNNPSLLSIGSIHDTATSFTLPSDAPSGEYYFSVLTTTPGGDSTRARTFVTAYADSIVPFQIGAGHARWIDSAILYELSPYFFVENGTFRDITEKIPDLLDLRINVIWLQPVMETVEPYQGYHTTNYFRLRPDLGTEEEFRELIATAHAGGLKVMLDIVPSHTSIEHPYAQDAILYGKQSHYYSFYNNGTMGGQGYSPVTVGLMTFWVYFWPTLVNLNFNSPEVQQMVLEAGRYWVEKYDIDGYRVDVAWGIDERKPQYTLTWCQALKRTKPEILLLAEDIARSSVVFEGRFDAAYDWSAVGRPEWSPAMTPLSLHYDMTNGDRGYHPRAIILHFLENNDMERSVVVYGVERVKMFAVLTMVLPGLPMLYNGQEVGAREHPYTGYPIFSSGASIKSKDTIGIYPFYKHLIGIKKKYASLSTKNFEELEVHNASMVYAFHRWHDHEHILGVANLDSVAGAATVLIPVSRLGLNTATTYYLTDLLTGDSRAIPAGQLDSVSASLAGNTMVLWYLSDHPVAVEGVERESTGKEAAVAWQLSQNWPNPFNPATTINYTVGRFGSQESGFSQVRLSVYDILGREVAELVNERQAPGRYKVTFNAGGLSSGVYFCRLEAAHFMDTKKLLLLK